MFKCKSCGTTVETIATLKRNGEKYDLCIPCFKTEIKEAKNETGQDQEPQEKQ